MTYQVSDLMANPALDLGSVTIYSGTLRLSRSGIAMVKSGEPAQPFGFFLPDATPLDGSAPQPERLIAEAWLMVCRSHGSGNIMGVEQVSASYEPDPRGGTARWLQLAGTAHAGLGIKIGYRITVQRAGS